MIITRLNRRKYDAAKTVAEFAATVRDEVDLNKLTERLVAVVEETMQPAHVSLWLKPAADRRPQMLIPEAQRSGTAVGRPSSAVTDQLRR